MARLVVAATGTWGDVGVFVPMANGLAKRGHDVTFVMPAEFTQLLAGESFGTQPVGDVAPAHIFEQRDAIRAGGLRAFSRWDKARLLRTYEALDELADAVDAFVVHPNMAIAARAIAEQRGTPWAVGNLLPMLVPSGERKPHRSPLPLLRGRAGRAVNRALWRAYGALHARRHFDGEVNAFRAVIGLPPRHSNVFHSLTSPHLTMMLTSPRYFVPPDDWLPEYRSVGFQVWQGPSTVALDREVDAYLDAGEPPVLVSLGTHGSSLSSGMFETVAKVLDDLGVRALLTVGFEENLTPLLRDRAGVWTFVPIDRVVSRCRAVVHTGGLGTVSIVLSHGIPSLVVPQLSDQRWHASRIDELGVGIGLAKASPSEDRLRRALSMLLDDERYATQAQRFGTALQAEDAPAAACDAIEEMLSVAAP